METCHNQEALRMVVTIMGHGRLVGTSFLQPDFTSTPRSMTSVPATQFVVNCSGSHGSGFNHFGQGDSKNSEQK